MNGVEWETLALMANGEISPMESIGITAPWKYSWSVIRSTLTISGFNILSKDFIAHITNVDENVLEDEEITFIRHFNSHLKLSSKAMRF